MHINFIYYLIQTHILFSCQFYKKKKKEMNTYYFLGMSLL